MKCNFSKIVVFLSLILLGAFCNSFAGKYGADFLCIPVGARPAAMGGAFTALADDATSFYWNPSGLAEVKYASLHFDHVPIFDGLAQYNAASLNVGLDANTALGVGWVRLGVDKIPRYGALKGTRLDRLTSAHYRSTGEPLGFFSDNEDAIFVSFGRKDYFEWSVGPGFNKVFVPMEFSFGMTGKYILHHLDDKKGIGQGLDVGIRARIYDDVLTNPQKQSWLGFGVMARDLSRTAIMWNTTSNHKDIVKPSFILGGALSYYISMWKSRLTLTCDRETGFYDEWRYGGEIRLFRTISLRGGYANSHFSAGAGLDFKFFRVDYAFVSNELAHTHRVSGGFTF